MTIHEGTFTEVRRDGRALTLRLTDEGREVIQGRGLDPRDDLALMNLLEEHRDRWGWERVWPDEIGSLTGDAHVLLSDDVERDDRGGIVRVGDLFGYPRHALDGYIEVLMECGELLFEAV